MELHARRLIDHVHLRVAVHHGPAVCSEPSVTLRPE